jgi:hypothetical protein
MPSAEQIGKWIERSLNHPGGPAGRIRELEMACGFHPIAVGSWFPFHLSEKDWKPDSVVTQDGKEIRIVLVNAISPGFGAFSRLIRAIEHSGFEPVVIEPMGETMPAIMERWGWIPTTRHVGSGDDVEEWRPKREKPK